MDAESPKQPTQATPHLQAKTDRRPRCRVGDGGDETMVSFPLRLNVDTDNLDNGRVWKCHHSQQPRPHTASASRIPPETPNRLIMSGSSGTLQRIVRRFSFHRMLRLEQLAPSPLPQSLHPNLSTFRGFAPNGQRLGILTT